MKHHLITMAAALLAAAFVAAPLAAAEPLDARVGTLEKQMKAVQRKVFPGGDPRYFTPEIAPDTAAPAAPVGVPATTPLADLTSRVDTLEQQQRTLTGAVEEAQNKLHVARGGVRQVSRRHRFPAERDRTPRPSGRARPRGRRAAARADPGARQARGRQAGESRGGQAGQGRTRAARRGPVARGLRALYGEGVRRGGKRDDRLPRRQPQGGAGVERAILARPQL